MRVFNGSTISIPVRNDGEKKYRLTVFRVLSKHEDGTPDELRLIADNEVCELSRDDWFVTAFLPECVLNPHS